METLTASKRVSIDRSGGSIECRIKVKRNWFPIFFFPVWLAGWTFGGIAAILSLFDHLSLFISFWLLLWAYGEYSAVRIWTWYVWGVEIVTIDSGYLTISRNARGYSRSKSFAILSVQNLRSLGKPVIFPDEVRDYRSVDDIGRIAFESGGKTHKFGIQLDEKESTEILEALREYLSVEAIEPPETAKPSKRLSYSDVGGYSQIRIKSRNNGLPTLLSPIWVIVSLIALIAYSVSDQDTSSYILLPAWGLFTLCFVCMWMWTLFGRELIIASTRQLTIRKELFGLGRMQHYLTDNIKNLGARGPYGPIDIGTLSILGKGSKEDKIKFHSKGTVAFEYGSKTFKFGPQLSKPEAEEIVARLRSYLSPSAFA
jgi:hypothetical protein